MNKVVDKFFKIGDKFMPEMHLKQPGFTYSACDQLTRNKQRIQRFMETEDTKYIYRNELDKACFQNDMALSKYDRYQRGLTSMVYKFFDKKSKGAGIKDETK